MQTILTQCPRCQTSFKVSDKQLAIAAGMVRCGSCLDVFSALGNRITIKQPAAAAQPPERSPDEYENQGNIEQQDTSASSSPAHFEDTRPHYPEAVVSHESSAFQPTYETSETSTNYDTGSIKDGLTDAAAVSEGSSTSDEEFEFILDYEDDIQVGDMMLDDAQQDALAADVLDANIHDAGDVAANHPYAAAQSPHGVFDEKYGERDSGEIAHVHDAAFEPVNVSAEPEFHNTVPGIFPRHEDIPSPSSEAASNFEVAFTAAGVIPPQEIISDYRNATSSTQGSAPATYIDSEVIAFAVSEPGAQLAEQPPAVLSPLDIDNFEHQYSAHAEQRVFDEASDRMALSGFDIVPAQDIETIIANDDIVPDQVKPDADAENIQAKITTTEPDEIFAHSPAADGDDPESLNPEESFTAEDFLSSADIHAPAFSALSSNEMEDNELTAATSPKPHTQRDKEELRQYLAELEDADALEPLPPTTVDSIEIDPLTFEVSHVFRKYATTFGWFILSIGLLAALVLQVVATNMEFMQRSSYSRYLPLFCRVLDCPEPERVTSTQSFNSQELLVRSHPSVPDAIEVSFIFRNDADMPQPFPLVELSFMDSSRRLMANRLLKPEEYLPPELAALDEMPASSSVQVMLEMADPGSDAVNYEIAFRDPATEAPIDSSTPAATP